MKSYRRLPDIPTGYVLDDVWSVVTPIARTNEVLNPSAEVATTGYTAGSGTLTRSTEQQYHGAYSLKYVPAAATTDGFFYGTISTTSGQTRAISCKFRGVAGVPYALTFATTGGVDLVVKTFVATGRWQWQWLYHNETSTTTRRIYFRKNGSANVGAFFVDGVQSEVINAGETVSTFISGDELGLVPNQSPAAYVWNGTPHASTSSRSGLTRAGGQVVPFKRYGFLLVSMVGLGLASAQNIGTDYARIDGGYDDYTRKPSRQFTLSGRFQGRTYAELRRQRGGLAQLLDRDLVGQDQRLTLMRHVEDKNGNITTSDIRVLAKYQGGLEGNTDNLHAEQAPITFLQYLPNILSDGEAGAALTVQTSVSNADYFITRTPAGVWQILGASGATGVVRAIAVGPNGDVYAGGDFLDFGGSGADYLARWNGSAWVTVGGATAVNNSVYALAFGPDGTLYVGGSFTNAGGVANADSIATWNGSAWGALSTGTAGSIFSIVVTPTGTLYVGGAFTAIGASTADNVAYWNGSVWANLAADAAINSSVYALVIGLDGALYVGGTFTNANGIADADGIAKWNGSAWSALSTGAQTLTDVRALAVDSAGWVYAGGQFTTIGGVAAARIARWNGVSWQALGSGITTYVDALSFVGNQLYVGGVMSTAGGISIPDGLAIWSGGSWVYTNVDLPGSATVYSLATGPDGTLYVGYDQSGTATAGSVTTIANTGTAKAYPTVKIYGPSSGTARIYSIINNTTNRAIYLNLTINVGETVTMVFQPDNLSFTSDFLGSVNSSILGGSNEADWFLQPGANSISFLSASSTVTATLYYRPAFASMDDVP